MRGDDNMPTSYDIDFHYFAKKAKSRLSGHDERKTSEYNKYTQRANDTYSLILRMATEEETVYNPIARFVGKDLKSVPDSSEKIRTVLETSKYVGEVRQRVRTDLVKKARNNEPVYIDGKEYDPLDLLRKLH